MNLVWIWVVDSAYQPIEVTELHAVLLDQDLVADAKWEDDRWVLEAPAGSRLGLDVSASGYEDERHVVRVRDEVTQVVIGLRKPGELSYTYGDNRLAFAPTDEVFLISVTGEGGPDRAQRALKRAKVKTTPVDPEAPAVADSSFLRVEASLDELIEIASKLADDKTSVELFCAIEHGERSALGLSNEVVASFQAELDRNAIDRLADSVGLQVTRAVHHAGNGFVLRGKDTPTYGVLEAADALADSDQVLYVEPNLTFAATNDAYVPNDTLYGQLPHLQVIGADDAWDLLDDVAVSLRGGSPEVTIAVVDLDGIAPNHPDLTANLTDGASKMASSTNFAASPIAAQTVAGLGGDHGTQCAASATAAFDENRGVAGVAPNCRLIGARQPGSVNAVAMADLYLWLAGFMNGSTAAGFPGAPPSQPADVISSSWGAYGLALSNTARDLFDFMTTYGRGGKGTVVCWSAGNSGYTDFTNPINGSFRAWPTYARCVGIGASINATPTNPIPTINSGHPTGQTNNVPAAIDTRAYYSPFGQTALQKPDLVAPSHSAYSPALVDPIMSAVRVGTGAVNGCMVGACNDYAQSFGGTSHATPTVAGAAALILSADPALNWVQVRDIFRATSARIDAAQANPTGAWQDLSSDGAIDYSRWYGAGRLDVEAAITTALDPTRELSDIYVRENLADDGTVPSGGNWWASPDIWVRQNAADPIPALAWNDPAPHQNAQRGQDNAIFMRVRNRGTGAASTLRLRAMITHWAGAEFVYPDDWQPTTNVGAPLPSPMVPGTYLLGEVTINDLAPGANQIAKITWDQSLIPPETVMVGGVAVNWHPCLLLEASPHDGPAPVGGLSVPVRGNNNIAQRNITIVPAATGDSLTGMVLGTRSKAGVATLVIDPTALRRAEAIGIGLANAELAKTFAASAMRAARGQRPGPIRLEPTIVLEDPTRIRLEPEHGGGLSGGGRGTLLEAAPGTRVITQPTQNGSLAIEIVDRGEMTMVMFRGLEQRIEVPLRLEAANFVPIAIQVAGKPEGDLLITQRRGDGELAGGYGVSFQRE